MKLVNLRVSNPYPTDVHQTPVSSGVPIPPKCELEHVQDVSLLDQDGLPVPVQCMPLSWYPDGKRIKWVLVSFLANVPAASASVYTLLIHERSKSPLSSKSIAEIKQGEVSIDTGSLRGTLQSGHAFFSNITCRMGDSGWRGLNGHPAFKLQLEDGVFTPGAPTRLEVEDNGPVRALIRLEGKYVSAGGDRESNYRYVLRAEAWQGRAELRLTHTVINEGADSRVNGLNVEWKGLNTGSYTIGRSDGKRFRILPADSVQGIMSESFDICTLGSLTSDAADQLTGTYDWWARADAEHWSLVTTIREFHERYPKSLEFTQDSLRAGLLPASSQVKDSFLPAGQSLDSYDLREGEARTHEFLLSIWPSETSDETIHQAMWTYHKPLLALAPWSWYTASGALGDLVPRPAEKYEEYEQAADVSLSVYLGRRERGKLYGDRNYGDDQDGQLGCWNNGEYDYTHVGMLHFLRGAGLAWYEQVARPYAKHLMDIDICHAGSGVGRIYQHSVRHNSEPPKLGSHAWLRGLMEYYCFSGDLRAREVALHVADTWSELILRGEGLEGTERGITWPIISMLGVYQIIPDEKYLQAAKKLVELVIECHDPLEGHFRGTMFRETTKDNWGTFVIGSPVLESLIMYEQLTGDERVRQIVVNAAKRLARLNWLEDVGEWEYTHSKLKGDARAHNAKTNKMVTPAVLYAYLYSGDEELLDKALLAYHHSVRTPASSGKDLGQSYCFGIRIPALIERCLAHREEILKKQMDQLIE